MAKTKILRPKRGQWALVGYNDSPPEWVVSVGDLFRRSFKFVTPAKEPFGQDAEYSQVLSLGPMVKPPIIPKSLRKFRFPKRKVT